MCVCAIFQMAESPGFGMSSTNICDAYYCLRNTMLGTRGWPKIEKSDNFDDLVVLGMSMDIMLLDS